MISELFSSIGEEIAEDMANSELIIPQSFEDALSYEEQVLWLYYNRADIVDISFKEQTEDGNVYTISLRNGDSYDVVMPYGPQGVQGEPGPQGDPGPQGEPGVTPNIMMTASVLPTAGVPDIQVTKRGTDAEPIFDLLFSGLKGADGQDGAPGAAGQGVPTGGSKGTVLAKSGSGNYATTWRNPTNYCKLTLGETSFGYLSGFTYDSTGTLVSAGDISSNLAASIKTAGDAYFTKPLQSDASSADNTFLAFLGGPTNGVTSKINLTLTPSADLTIGGFATNNAVVSLNASKWYRLISDSKATIMPIDAMMFDGNDTTSQVSIPVKLKLVATSSNYLYIFVLFDRNVTLLNGHTYYLRCFA